MEEVKTPTLKQLILDTWESDPTLFPSTSEDNLIRRIHRVYGFGIKGQSLSRIARSLRKEQIFIDRFNPDPQANNKARPNHGKSYGFNRSFGKNS